MNQKIKMGLVGLGSRARFGWIPGMKLVDDIEITALSDREEKCIGWARETLGADVPGYADIDQLLHEADVDAIGVCTDPLDQAELIIKALEAGKHVICEVSLAYSIEECWDILVAVERSGCKFQMAEQLRFSPWVKAWRDMILNGDIGHVSYVEGGYIHGMDGSRFYMDADTLELLNPEQAKTRNAVKTRIWNIKHPIDYPCHELSPMLKVLDDRIVRVTGMENPGPSKVFDFLERADMGVGLFQTAKGTLIKLTNGFQIQCGPLNYHANRMIGTKGWVEQNRTLDEDITASAHGQCWLSEHDEDKARAVRWDFPEDTPPEVLASGHGGLDVYPFMGFADHVLRDAPCPMDIYAAMEATVPGLMAGISADRGSIPMEVPEFRPGSERSLGQYPHKVAS